MRPRIQTPEIVSQNLSDIKDFLVTTNLNQTELAKLAGVSRQYVSMIMKGQRPPSQKLMDIVRRDDHALSV
jgi:transcriptional regulator with XRE-family HTH domain